jgi:hypothetical protein
MLSAGATKVAQPEGDCLCIRHSLQLLPLAPRLHYDIPPSLYEEDRAWVDSGNVYGVHTKRCAIDVRTLQYRPRFD